MNWALVSQWFLGNREAVAFAAAIWDVMQKWDDVIDEGETASANDVFSFLLIRMDLDPFFSRHSVVLRPVLFDMYLSWRDATEMEKSGDPADLEKAFMLRAGIYRLYALMAWLIGGEAHSRKVGPEIHRTYGERLADYIKEHTHA